MKKTFFYECNAQARGNEGLVSAFASLVSLHDILKQ